MKRAVRIINCAAGRLVDEQALVGRAHFQACRRARPSTGSSRRPATKNVLFGHTNGSAAAISAQPPPKRREASREVASKGGLGGLSVEWRDLDRGNFPAIHGKKRE